MKMKSLSPLTLTLTATLLIISAQGTVLAQNGPGPQGLRPGFGHPTSALDSPAYTEEEKQMILQVAPKFVQREFTDGRGTTLKYNLFIPDDYNPQQSYPLVLFIHDAGGLSEDTTHTLYQGTGAIYFASPEDQAKHPCFVLAPQYSTVMESPDTELGQATFDLLEQLFLEFSIDRKRVYNTGQSMGGMFALASNIAYPDFFAASYLVACQWETDEFYRFAKKPMWIVVAEGDPKAYPGMQEGCKAWAAAGAKIAEAQWDGSHLTDEYTSDVQAMLGKDANIRFVHFKLGTVPSSRPSDSGPRNESAGQDEGPGSGRQGMRMEHNDTWPVAYRIGGIRDWLFEQVNDCNCGK